MLRRTVFLAGCVALLAAIAPAVAAAKVKPAGPALATPVSTLQQSLTCNGSLAGIDRDPVLLVHGTFADSEINWSWNYKLALPARGETACTVDLPDKSAGDIQVSTEYVVYAIRAMARESGRKVAVIGHSQGGLEIRWALRWWPDIRHLVSDAILLNTPNQGSAFPDALCTVPGGCAASLYQMRTGSNFLKALNEGRQTVGGVSYTILHTETDPIFVLPQQAILDTSGAQARNIAIQEVCPGRQVDHNGIVFDAASYAIVTDALDHRGPADPARVDPAVCLQDTMPGVTRAEADARLQAYGATLLELLGPNGPKAPGEPPLADYTTGHSRP